jgi:hypothetical protein
MLESIGKQFNECYQARKSMESSNLLLMLGHMYNFEVCVMLCFVMLCFVLLTLLCSGVPFCFCFFFFFATFSVFLFLSFFLLRHLLVLSGFLASSRLSGVLVSSH